MQVRKADSLTDESNKEIQEAQIKDNIIIYFLELLGL